MSWVGMSVPNGAPAGVAKGKRVATSPTVREMSSATKTKAVAMTIRFAPFCSHRCMKKRITRSDLLIAMMSAI